MEEIITEVYRNLVTQNTLRVFVIKGRETASEIDELLRPKGIVYKELVSSQENYSIYIENKNPELPEIAIVTDSTTDLTAELIEGYDVSVIPLKIKFKGGEYLKQGIDVNNKEFS